MATVCLLYVKFSADFLKAISTTFGASIKRRLGKLQRDAIDRLTLPDLRSTEVFRIVTRLDEAWLWLLFVRGIASVPFHIWRPSLVAIGLTALTFWSVHEAILEEVVQWWSYRDVVALLHAATLSAAPPIAVLTALFAAQGVLLIIPFVLRGHALSFGEHIVDSWLLDVKVSRDFSNAKCVIRKQYPLRRILRDFFRHSALPQDETIGREWSRWILDKQIPPGAAIIERA